MNVTESIAAASRSLAARPRPTGHHRPIGRRQLKETFTRFAGAIAALEATSCTGLAATPALQSSVAKLSATACALGRGTDLTDALGLVLLQRSQQTGQRSQIARSQIARKLDQSRHQTMAELKQIQKRIAEQGQSSLWDIVGKVFKAIGAVCGTVAGLASGNGLLIAGAALAVGSLATSFGDHSACAQVSLCLGLAGAGASLGGAFVDLRCISGLAEVLSTQTARVTTDAASGGAGAGSAAAGVVKAIHDSGAKRAEAASLEARTARADLQREAGEERGTLRTLLEAEQRGISLVIASLHTEQRAALAAIRGASQ